MSASARASMLCSKSRDMWMMSYKDLHEMAGRAMPFKLANYKLALQLYKTFTQRCPTLDWINLNLNIINTSRQSMFPINKTNRLKVGYNALSSRFHLINGMVNLKWLNLSFASYKIK